MNTILTTLNAKYIHTSLALRYLKAHCEQEVPMVKMEEYSINDMPSKVAAELFQHGADIIGFACYVWNLEESLAVAEILKKVAPNTLVVFGGPEVSYNPKEFLEKYDFVDLIAYGEGEETFKEFLVALKAVSKNNRDILSLSETLSGIDGLAYRVGEGITINEPRPLIENLDIIPSPFLEESIEYQNKIAYIESTRGCPFSCQYCLSSTIKGVRYFSLDRIKQDLKKLINAKVKQVKFVDRTFNCSKERAMEIFRFLRDEVDQDSDTNFHFEVAADLLDDEMVEYLITIPKGLFQFEIGVQSTNPNTLALIQRKMDLQKVGEMVTKLRAANNIHLHLDLIAGLPEENWDSFRKSFNHVYALKPHKLQLGFLKLLKGSGLRKKEGEYKYSYINKPPYEVLENAYLSYTEILRLKQLEELLEQYFNSYRFNYSVKYLVDNYFETPFDFYHHFAMFWEKNGYFHLAHNQASLFEILGEFLKGLDQVKYPLFKDILKLDYLMQGSMKGIPEYFYNSQNKSEERKVKKDFYSFLQNPTLVEDYVPHLKDMYFKHLGKNMRVEIFDFDVLELTKGKIKSIDIPQKMNSLVFNYFQRDKIFNRAQLFKLPTSL